LPAARTARFRNEQLRLAFTSVEVALERLIARRVKLKFYEAGMDMGWSQHAPESFTLFQSKVLDEYQEIVGEHDLHVIEANEGITAQQQIFRGLVSQHLEGAAQ
jgi:dTMP kinase